MATRLAKGRAIAIDRTNIANDRRFELFLCSFLSPLFRSGEKRKDMVLLFKSYYSYVVNHDTYPNQFVCTSFCTPTTTTPTHIDRPCWRKSVALSVAFPKRINQ